MKRLIAVLCALSLILCLSACASVSDMPAAEAPAAETAAAAQMQDVFTSDSAETEDETEPQPEESADDAINDEAWDMLESMGDIETENGIFYVNITLPASLVGEDVTQDSINTNAGENYTSGKLNEDGSVTYKLTKQQHKAMLDELVAGFDESLNELVEDPDYSFVSIEHNDDFSVFDVSLSTDELGLVESFATLTFYMCGGTYALFEGRTTDNVAVNFYDSTGALISTANSADMGE